MAFQGSSRESQVYLRVILRNLRRVPWVFQRLFRGSQRRFRVFQEVAKEYLDASGAFQWNVRAFQELS